MFTPKCPSREVEILPVPAPFVGVGLAVPVGSFVEAVDLENARGEYLYTIVGDPR